MTSEQIDTALRDGRALPKETESKAMVPNRIRCRCRGNDRGPRHHRCRFVRAIVRRDAVGRRRAMAAEGDGICWIATPADGGVPRFLLRTKFGLEEITTLEHLQLRLAMVAPGPPPEDDAARGALLRIRYKGGSSGHKKFRGGWFLRGGFLLRPNFSPVCLLYGCAIVQRFRRGYGGYHSTILVTLTSFYSVQHS
jgi:hypothetical protein